MIYQVIETQLEVGGRSEDGSEGPSIWESLDCYGSIFVLLESFKEIAHGILKFWVSYHFDTYIIFKKVGS